MKKNWVHKFETGEELRGFWAWTLGVILGGGWSPGETRPKNWRKKFAGEIRWEIHRQFSKKLPDQIKKNLTPNLLCRSLGSKFGVVLPHLEWEIFKACWSHFSRVFPPPLSGLPNANAKSQRFSHPICQIAPLPPVVALNRSFKSQIAARYTLRFGTQLPKLHWPLSFSASNNSQRFRLQRLQDANATKSQTLTFYKLQRFSATKLFLLLGYSVSLHQSLVDFSEAQSKAGSNFSQFQSILVHFN